MNTNTTTAVSNYAPTNNTIYKVQENWATFAANSFPIRRLLRSSSNSEQAWLTAYKAESKKYFEAVLTNQKLDQLNKDQQEKEDHNVPKRKLLKKLPFAKNESKDPGLLDGFYMMHLCCIEDPLDLSIVEIANKGLVHIKEDDMLLFENISEINANENLLNFESFKCFTNLKKLHLACNNIKSIRAKHEEFTNLESLDLSYNCLNPNDIAHLGVLVNLKSLKLTGNNLHYLPDTFSKLYVYTKDNKKIVTERFPNLEELHLDHNNLKEEDSFDVLAVLKKLKKLHLNNNQITCVPNLKVFRKNHVYQEFNKSYFKRKLKKTTATSNSARQNRRSLDSKINEAIVKDLERSNSEMNIHASNLFRNSFILEENEDEPEEKMSPLFDEDNENKLSNNSLDAFDKSFDLPFSELVFIDLSDNKISEEDDLIALAKWPMLNEIIIYGNPIVYNNIGYPPLLKEYLIDRLGMSIHRIRPLKPLKVPIVLPNREHRVIETEVPKIPKMPLEMRMLTFDYGESDEKDDEHGGNNEQNKVRSNVSSAESFQGNLEKKRTSVDSFDTVGHRVKNEHVFMPFKKEKLVETALKEDSQQNKEGNPTNKDKGHSKPTNENDKNYNSFFMTQVDQEESLPKVNEEHHQPIIKDKAQKSSKKPAAFKKLEESSNKKYDLLYQIENEDQIKVPKDLNGSVRALKQMLDNPLVLRDPCKELDKPQPAYKLKDTVEKPKSKPQVQPRIKEINEILDTIKDRQTVREYSLADALSSSNTDKKEFEKAKKIYEKAQRRYEKVKQESLKSSVPQQED